MNDVFKIRGGTNEYSDKLTAIQVAQAKASATEKPVTVCRKNLREFEPALEVHPDGSQQQPDD